MPPWVVALILELALELAPLGCGFYRANSRANSSISAMRPPCYDLLEEIVTLGVIYESLVWITVPPCPLKYYDVLFGSHSSISSHSSSPIRCTISTTSFSSVQFSSVQFSSVQFSSHRIGSVQQAVRLAPLCSIQFSSVRIASVQQAVLLAPLRSVQFSSHSFSPTSCAISTTSFSSVQFA